MRCSITRIGCQTTRQTEGDRTQIEANWTICGSLQFLPPPESERSRFDTVYDEPRGLFRWGMGCVDFHSIDHPLMDHAGLLRGHALHSITSIGLADSCYQRIAPHPNPQNLKAL
jgi:hypothetical protein